ncbi:MAG: hypothetical protein K2O70_02990, partial [Desulfovibrionaceae bacterium]|nr:hypothetical protein [Desulfovibrionaceae bacterium]
HGLRNYPLLRIPLVNLWKWNGYRIAEMQKNNIDPETQKRYSIPLGTKEALPEKFPHHISWHVADKVSPFVWLREKDDEGQYKLTEPGKILSGLNGGYILALNDPIGICRELSALCEHSHEDEALYWESIAYPYTIAVYIQSIAKKESGSDILQYIREYDVDIFLKTAHTVFSRIAEYFDAFTEARKIWMHSDTGCKKRLWECFEDLTQDTKDGRCARERLLATVVSGLAHHDNGLALADTLFKEEEENLLWSTLYPPTQDPFPETPGTEQIIASLWRYFLPTDAARAESAKKLFKSLENRKIFVQRMYSDRDMKWYGKALRGEDAEDAPTRDPGHGTLVYPTIPQPEVLQPPLANPFPEGISIEPQYNSFMPKSLEAHWGLQDLKAQDITASYRLKVTLLAAYNVWLVHMKKDPGTAERWGQYLTAAVGITGLLEWGLDGTSFKKTALGCGVANKVLGAFLGFLIAGATGMDAVKALREKRYAQGLQQAGISAATALIGYSSLAKAIESITTTRAKISVGLRAAATRALTRLPWGKAVAGMCLGPPSLVVLMAADAYALYGRTTTPLNIW